jgi:hypothetical protein
MKEKPRVASIAVGALLHFMTCLACGVIVSVFKLRSEAVFVIAGFYVPFTISGALLSATHGISRPVMTSLISACLAAVIVALFLFFVGGKLPFIAITTMPSVLLSVIAAVTVAQVSTSHGRFDKPSHNSPT